MALRCRMFLLLAFCCTLFACGVSEAPTEVFLIRHAEKTVWDNPDTTAVYDPELSEAGLERAARLPSVLEDREISVIYCTDFKRNMATVKPMSESLGIEIREYEAHNWQPMLDEIQSEFKGQKVLICGHSNNLFPIMEGMNGIPPQDSLAKEEYDKIFHLLWSGDGTEVEVIVF